MWRGDGVPGDAKVNGHGARTRRLALRVDDLLDAHGRQHTLPVVDRPAILVDAFAAVELHFIELRHVPVGVLVLHDRIFEHF